MIFSFVTISVRAESALEYMKQSHRVIIILTSEYLRDHWDYYILQKVGCCNCDW